MFDSNKLKRKRIRPAIFALASTVLLATAGCIDSQASETDEITQTQEVSVLMPSDAVLLTWRDAGKVETRNTETQKGIASSYFSVTKTNVDMPLEKLALGEMYFLSFAPDAAREQYAELEDQQDDLIARHARKRLLRMNFAAYNEFELVESQIREYRENYPATIIDYYGVYGAIRDLANYYVDENRTEEAIALILTELADRDRAAKQASPRLLADFAEVFVNSNRTLEHQALIDEYMPLVQQQRSVWQVQSQSLDLAQVTTCSKTDWDWYWTMNGVRSGETVVDARARNIDRTLEKLAQSSSK